MNKVRKVFAMKSSKGRDIATDFKILIIILDYLPLAVLGRASCASK
jgi:hypothetical protein